MFGVSILNYINFKETIEAVENLSRQVWFDNIKVYVVDNGSYNESVSKLKELQKKVPFILIESDINLGHFKGANLAIRRARYDGCEFVMELDSDARILDGQDDFFNIILDIYNTKKNVALITPDIKNLDGAAQNPMNRHEFSLLKKLLLKIFFYMYIDKIYFLIRIHVLFSLITWYVTKRDLLKKSLVSNITPKSGYIYAAHGSCQVLTPLYFKHFDGHTEEIFLYCEEYIKAEHLKSKGLKTWYDERIHALHKESKTIEMITKGHKEKVKFLLVHMFDSGRVFVRMLKLY
jgi:GT2 family glycosyltransferase